MSSPTVKYHLEEWEIFCPVCEGLGKKPGTNLICKKCGGDGKLDWVENIVGKRKKHLEFYFKEMDLYTPDTELMKEIASSMAEEMSKAIDKEIMKQILGRDIS